MHGDGIIFMHGDGVISPGLLWRQIPVENDIARIQGGVRYSIQESGGRVLEKPVWSQHPLGERESLQDYGVSFLESAVSLQESGARFLESGVSPGCWRPNHGEAGVSPEIWRHIPGAG